MTQTNVVTLAPQQRSDPNLKPDWILIGVLVACIFLLVAGSIGGLWHFRRQTWGMIGSALPRYRNLGMDVLTSRPAHESALQAIMKRAQMMANGEEHSKSVPTTASRPITLRLDEHLRDFDPEAFTDVIAEEAGVLKEQVVILSLTEGTVCRFVIARDEKPQDAANDLIDRIADQTNEIHSRLPILAFDSAEENDLTNLQHPAFTIAAIDNEYWDYERQIDLEEFNVRMLYDKLEDQTLQIVSHLTHQKDDLFILCDKVLVESEALKDMFVRVKLDIDSRNKKEQDVLELREKKMRDGLVEFDLPEELKALLARFIEDFFKRQLVLIQESLNLSPVVTNEETVVKTNLNTVVEAMPSEQNNEDPEADITNVQGFNEMFGKTLNTATLTEARGSRQVDAMEFPKEIRDDSDLEEDDRLERGEQRERFLLQQLNRSRRAADSLILPFALEADPTVEKLFSADQTRQNGQTRLDWKRERRAERSSADTMPTYLEDNASLSYEQRADRSSRRQVKLYDRLRRLRAAISAIEVPESLQNDDQLSEKDKEIRNVKRVNYLNQKLDKLRRARAESLVPIELMDEPSLDPDVRAKRKDQFDDAVSAKLKAASREPDLPRLDEKSSSPEHLAALRKAHDFVVNARVDLAGRSLQDLDVPNGLSENSELDATETKNRSAAREARGLAGSKSKSKSKPSAPSKFSSVVLKRQDFKALMEENRRKKDTDVPEDYRDDSDLDDEERKRRGDLRVHFRKGKCAPLNSRPPLVDSSDHNMQCNTAFKQGQAAVHGMTPEEIKRRADQIEQQSASLSDPQTTNLLQLGKKKEEALNIPAEYLESTAKATRQAKAFVDGKRAASVIQIPEELSEAPGLTVPQSNDRRRLVTVYEEARQQQKDISTPLELQGDSELERGFELGRRVQQGRAFEEFVESIHASRPKDSIAFAEAFQKGRQAAKRLEAPEGLDDASAEAFALGVDGLDAPNTTRSNPQVEEAYRRGCDAKKKAFELMPAEFNDEIALLPPEVLRRRREMQAAFRQGLRTAQAEHELEERSEKNTISRDTFKKAVEAGHRAQKTADTIPTELEGPGDDAEKKRIAFIQGRAAAHMECTFTEDSTFLSEKEKREIAQARETGRAAQLSYDEIPEELKPNPSLPPEEQKKRSNLRSVFNAVAKHSLAAHSINQNMIAEKKIKEQDEKSGTAQENAAESAADKEFVRHKRDQMLALKQLKKKQAVEMSAGMAELEDEFTHRSKKLDEEMSESFAKEAKRLRDRHTFELLEANPAAHEGLKARHLQENQQLERSQQESRKEAQTALSQRQVERKAKVKTILETKAMNELRLLKTLHNNQDQEIQRLREQAEADASRGSITREEELRRQKDILMERVKAREKRMKAKMSKEKDFLEQQLAATSSLEKENLESALREKENIMIKRAEEMAKHGLIEPKELDAEISRIHKDLLSEREQKFNDIQTAVHAERIAREKELSERHAEEKKREMAAVQTEVDELIQEQRQLHQEHAKEIEEANLSAESQSAMNLLLQQQEQRRDLQLQLEKQRLAELEKAKINDQRVREEAQREVTRRESELGKKLTDQQKEEIFSEAARNASRMGGALTEEQHRQNELMRKKLEERKRRKEQELHRKQLDEMKAEIQRQEEQRRTREQDVKQSLGSTSAELTQLQQQEVRELENKKQRELEALKQKHTDEQQDVEKQLQEEMERSAQRELKRIQAEAEKRMMDEVAKQSAELSQHADEATRKQILSAHEAQNQSIKAQLATDAAIQEERVRKQLEARRARKHADLLRRQQEELRSTATREDEAREAVVRNAIVEAERQAIKKASADPKLKDKTLEVAQAVMAKRHRDEVQMLAEKQKERMNFERERFDSLLSQKRETLTATIEAEIDKEAFAVLPGAQRDDRIREIRARGRTQIEARTAELEQSVQSEKESFLDSLELEFAEQQLQLRLQHWNEVSSASGSTSQNVGNRYESKLAAKAVADSEKELLAFRQAKESEARLVEDKLTKEKADYEAKMQAEFARRRQEQQDELKRRERELLKKLEIEKQQREKKLRELRMGSSGQENEDARNRLIEEGKRDEERLKETIQREKDRQENELQEILKRKRERNERRKQLMEQSSIGPDSNAPLSKTTLNNVLNSVTTTAPTSVPTSSVVASSAGETENSEALNRWVTNMMSQLQASPLMEKLVNIERNLESRVKHGMMSFYLDAKDKALQMNEGHLTPLSSHSLKSQQFIVYFFARQVYGNLSRTVNVPSISIEVATTLPASPMNASAFRNSYFYDQDRKVLYLRDTRLSVLGECCVVLVHALAHIKSSTWSDTDPKFLETFYGLLECCTEELFFTRLSRDKAVKPADRGQVYRPEAIMTSDSLAGLEKQLRKVDAQDRDAWLRSYFQM